MFGEEICAAETYLPSIVFCDFGDDHNSGIQHNPQGNFQTLFDLLQYRTLEAKSGDGNAGGSEATSSSGPSQQGRKDDVDAGGDAQVGQSPTPPLPTYAGASTESGTIAAPYPSGDPEGSRTATTASSGSEARINSTLSTPEPSSETVGFQSRAKGPAPSNRVWIMEIEPATCLDVSSAQLLKMYVHKINEAARWRIGWDSGTEFANTDRASKGQQRRGAGVGARYVYGKEPTPPYAPNTNAEIELQVAELLVFCSQRCYIPESFWLNEAAKRAKESQKEENPKGKGKAKAPTDPDQYDIANEMDYRIIMLLRLVTAMYGTPYCSFVEPSEEDPRRNDTHYFPKNCGFLEIKRVTGIVAAAMITANLQTDLGMSNMAKGRHYLAVHKLMICDTLATDIAGLQMTPSSSSSAAPSAARPKLAVTPPGASRKSGEEEDYDRAV